MSTFTDAMENSVLSHYFRNGTGATITAPATVYMSLYTVAPTDSTAGTEVTGGGYTRQTVTFNAASGGTITNNGAVSWTASGANYGDVVAVGFMDASTAGNLMAYDGITTATVNDGDTISFADATGISISLD